MRSPPVLLYALNGRCHRQQLPAYTATIPHRPAVQQGGFRLHIKGALPDTGTGERSFCFMLCLYGLTVALMPMRTFSVSRRETVTS